MIFDISLHWGFPPPLSVTPLPLITGVLLTVVETHIGKGGSKPHFYGVLPLGKDCLTLQRSSPFAKIQRCPKLQEGTEKKM
jgi:hypothetical protein